MKHLLPTLFLLLFTSEAFPQKEAARLDSLLSSVFPGDRPGAAIAVLANGKLILKKGYGIADLTTKMSVRTSTNFNIGSMTKQFTAYGILKLASEKKLSLDDKIGRYFPDFNPKVSGRITIRHLLTHSSGIIDHYNYVDKKLYTEFWDKDALNAVKSVDSVYFPAGNGFRYSNTAYCLLSLIIEQVSGFSYPDFLREYIFKPLKMNNSDVIKPGFKIRERALGYEFGNGSFRKSDAAESLFFTTEGDGGIYTSIDDYLKWLAEIQNGKAVDQDLIKQAQTAYVTIDASKNLSYGYGWYIKGSGDNKIIYHPGSNGGFQSIVYLEPSKKYAMVIFSNRTGIDLEDIVGRINNILITEKNFSK